ncbi:MAG: FkbM family methyltransferase [Sediminibacterium sp.]|nr:FkbM family methyltransferase [Sediminibacterium sp.]
MAKKIEYYFNLALHYFREIFLWDFLFLNRSYSQEGEDIILDRVLGHIKRGFYVDIGAHHPKRLSNTYKFYKKGWKGINIDAMPGSMRKFNLVRRRDLNLECAITNDTNSIEYYVFNEPALNTFSKENADLWSTKAPYRIIKSIKVKGDRLDNIFNRYLAQGQNIDFMSIDVEGYELEVLLTNNWDKFRPKVIVLEVQSFLLDDSVRSKAVSYLQDKGYTVVSKLYFSIILCEADFANTLR